MGIGTRLVEYRYESVLGRLRLVRPEIRGMTRVVNRRSDHVRPCVPAKATITHSTGSLARGPSVFAGSAKQRNKPGSRRPPIRGSTITARR